MTTPRTIEERILRLEVLRGLEEAPAKWVPQEHLDVLRAFGIGNSDARRMLVSNFGALPADITARMERVAKSKGFTLKSE